MEDENLPPGYQNISGHIIFDVKTDNFIIKSRYFDGGQMKGVPAATTYTGVVSRESMRIKLTL